MTKLFIVHGVGSFQERTVLEDVGRLAAACDIDSGDVHAFNWDSRVNRVFDARSFNLGVLSEISAGTLNAANLGFTSGEGYVGIPRWLLVVLNSYALIIQVCGILWLPVLMASIVSHAVRLTALGVLGGFLTLMLLASLLSPQRCETLRAGFRRLVLTVAWPLLYSAAAPFAAALLPCIFLLGLPIIGFFVSRGAGIAFFPVLMLEGIGALLLLHALQKGAEPILKIFSDIFRYIGIPPYRKRLVQELTDAMQGQLGGCDHVIILAHSLGSVITVDSLLSGPNLLGNVARVDLVTMGSPLKRMFYGGFPELFASPERIWESLTARLNSFRWINVYRPLDVVGARISTARVSPIMEFNTQEYLKNHTNYWSDVCVAGLIQQALATSKPAALSTVARPIENWRADLATIGYRGWLGKIWRSRATSAEAVAVGMILIALGGYGLMIRSAVVLWYVPGSSWTNTALLTAFYLAGLVLVSLLARQLFTRFLRPFLQSFYGTWNDDNPSGEVRPVEVNQPATPANWRPLIGVVTALALVLAVALLYVIRKDRVWQQDARPMIVWPQVLALAFSDDGRLGIANANGVEFRTRDANGCYGTIVSRRDLRGVTGIAQNLKFAVAATPPFSGCFTVFDLEHPARTREPHCSPGSHAGSGAVSPTGRFLALLVGHGENGRLLVRDLVRKADLPQVPIQLGIPAAVTFTQDNCAAASNGKQILRYCDLDKANPTFPVAFTISDSDIDAFTFSGNGTLAILDSLGDIVVYKQGVPVSRMRAETKTSPSNPSTSLAFSPDGQILAMARNREITFWRWQKYEYFLHLLRPDEKGAKCGAP